MTADRIKWNALKSTSSGKATQYQSSKMNGYTIDVDRDKEIDGQYVWRVWVDLILIASGAQDGFNEAKCAAVDWIDSTGSTADEFILKMRQIVRPGLTRD